MCEIGDHQTMLLRNEPDGEVYSCDIDHCIMPIVAVLQALELYTTSSCCGHGVCDGYILLYDDRLLRIKSQKEIVVYDNGYNMYLEIFHDHARKAGYIQRHGEDYANAAFAYENKTGFMPTGLTLEDILIVLTDKV
jgi:hypothetical protein